MLSETIPVLPVLETMLVAAAVDGKVSDPVSIVVFMNRITGVATGFIPNRSVKDFCQWRRLGSTV